jgi:hypothetical protein
VAKYGSRWERTRTIVDSFTPQWNEQYSWDVHDLCTVLIIGVFDNGHVRTSRRFTSSKGIITSKNWEGEDSAIHPLK